jgi:hypothetical protein
MTESIMNAQFTNVDGTSDPESFVRHLDRMTASDEVQASKQVGETGSASLSQEKI